MSLDSHRGIKPAGYETKPEYYFQQTRPEMLPFIPANCKRILDVGCGSGGFGQTLKKTRTVEVWGIEPVAKFAAEAASRLDRVIEAPFSRELDFRGMTFDCIIFNDVLEHLLDPAEALSVAKQLLSSGGQIVASIPNIRHFPTIWDLVVRGQWVYRDSGILDQTHLRFFTRKSIEPLFTECGLVVERLQGINRYCTLHNDAPAPWRAFKILNLMSLSCLDDMSYLQFAVAARSSEL
jgi:2-polyprenyl-3-methyl-5-hydroxy-6-metoxy-1,4-benzoquinol methylase